MILGMIATQRAAPASTDYSDPGPCGVTVASATFPVPEEQQGDLGATLTIELLVPTRCAAAPAPLLIFFNGFSLRCSDYAAITHQAASWGYVVAGYNLPRFRHTPAAAERDAFPSLLSWLQDQGGKGDSPLHGVVNGATRVVVAGHSRGGKIAGLVFSAELTPVAAAWLIDPVDSSRFAPISEEDPSGVEAVRATGGRVGVVGAGITRPFLGPSCNPPDGNYMKFYGAGGPGSWQVLVPGASHVTFESAGALVDAAQDLLCGFGRISRPTAAALAAVPMLNWFERELQGWGGGGGDGTLPPAFAQWVRDRQAQGLIKFFEKGGGVATPLELGGGGGSGKAEREAVGAAAVS